MFRLIVAALVLPTLTCSAYAEHFRCLILGEANYPGGVLEELCREGDFLAYSCPIPDVPGLLIRKITMENEREIQGGWATYNGEIKPIPNAWVINKHTGAFNSVSPSDGMRTHGTCAIF